MTGTIRWSLALATATAATVPLRAQGAPPVIAVLPFENTGSYGQDKESFEALEIGLPRILASTLAAHPDARVADHARMRQALEQQKLGATRRLDAASATAVAKAVGARYAITGSFADFYGKFRITTRVVDAETGQILKVVSNDDPKLQDRDQLGAIVQQVADRIVTAAGLAPYPADIAAKRRAVPTEALTDFSRGLMYEDRGDRTKAAEAYQRALTAAPDWTDPRDGLQRVRAG